MKKIEVFIHTLESKKMNFSGWLITFYCLMLTRGILELSSAGINVFSQKDDKFIAIFLHIPFFFLSWTMLFIIIYYFVTKERIDKIAKLVLFGSVIFLAAPIIDIAVFGLGNARIGYNEGYYLFSNIQSVISLVFGFILWGPFGILFDGSNSFVLTNLDTDYGIRIEILLILITSIWYIFIKTRNIAKVINGLFFLYCAFFLTAFFPHLIAWLFRLESNPIPFINESNLIFGLSFDRIMASLHFLVVLVLGVVFYFIHNRYKFFLILKNTRIIRMGIYLLFLIIGLVFGLCSVDQKIVLKQLDYLIVMMSFVSIGSFWLASVFLNDLTDIKIDKISSPSRPLASGKLSKKETLSIYFVFQIISVIGAILAGYAFFVMMILIYCLGYLYSVNPFRLRRIPIINSLALGLCALLSSIGGYLLIEGNRPEYFPVKLVIIIFLGFSFVVNFKDIKDYRGDKENHIYTLPVLFGLKNSKSIIGILGIFAFLLYPVLYGENILIFTSLLLGIGYYFYINRKQYAEKPIFIILFTYLFIILGNLVADSI